MCYLNRAIVASLGIVLMALMLPTRATAQTTEAVELQLDEGASLKAAGVFPDIWYFNGANAQNYPEELGVTFVQVGGIPSPPTAQITFQILNGSSVVWKQNSSTFYTAPPGVRTATLKSVGSSLYRYDVTIRASYSGGDTPFYVMSALTPGFTAVMTVFDQFGSVLPNAIEVNETKGQTVKDYIQNGRLTNWYVFPTGHTNYPVLPTTLNDRMTGPGTTFIGDDGQSRYPVPGTPNQLSGNYSGRQVIHVLNLVFYAGSLSPGQGAPIYSATQQYYREHAQHE
jgi:hypothetical protein